MQILLIKNGYQNYSDIRSFYKYTCATLTTNILYNTISPFALFTLTRHLHNCQHL